MSVRARTQASRERNAPALARGPASRPIVLAAVTALLVSAAALGYEVALTSIFAVVLQYNAVYLAVAAGMSGMGFGALVIGRVARRRQEVLGLLLPVTVLAAVVMAFATWAAFQVDPASSSFVIATLAFLPFTLLGAALAIVLRVVPEGASMVYAADLAGGALGSAGVIFLLNQMGGVQTALTLAVLPALAGLVAAVAGRRRPWVKVVALLSLLAVAVLPVLNASAGFINFRFQATSDPSGDKTMLAMIHDQGGKVVATRWNAFGRTDLVETPDSTRKFLFVNGGAGAPMYRFDGDLSHVADLKTYMEYMPFAVTQPRRVLVIGAGGGVDVLMAKLGGATEITAVEINPGAVDLVHQYRNYNGNIFDQPGVNLVEGDGRNFVSRDRSQYDLILLNLVYTQAAEAHAYALSENYVFTEEAFSQYLKRLSPGGTIAVITHNPLEATRAYFTGLAALNDEGISGPAAAHRTALWFWPDGPIEEKQSLVLIRNSEYTKDEAQALQTSGTKFGLKDMYLPQVNEFMLAPLILGKTTIAKMARQGDYNLWPSTDNQPFFYNLEKSLPDAVGGLLVLAIVGLFALVLLSAALADKAPGEGGHFWKLLFYFVLIGAGYMLIQVSVIQRSTLLLGTPTLAVSLVLVVMLLGGSAGSAASRRLIGSRLSKRSGYLGLAIAACVAVYMGLLPLVDSLLLPLPLVTRAVLFALVLLPLTFLMGMPFPTGLRLADGDGRATDIPLLYGLNGAASVLGSAAAVAVAISGGYLVVMGVGAALYACLPLAARRLD